ncbi:uncharacterized protein [Halyomorpha halys]|uniref:uncharacterized protein n=1 Tax=Halyomorpha halys TaxID=286706 RepID=UPI0006D4FBAC|nr:uncharacterized protein LOC106689419 [Halyomorpha halys]
MKNYLRHSFPGNYPSGRSRISVLRNQPQNMKSSDPESPLKRIILGNVADNYQWFGTTIKQTNEKKQNKIGWLNNLFWNHNSVNIIKGDFIETKNAPIKEFRDQDNKFGSHLKKYFSACNFFDKKFISFKSVNHKSAENIVVSDSIDCEDPSKQLKLTTKFNCVEPIITYYPERTPFFYCKKSRSHSSIDLRNNFLRPCNEILDNGRRSFTTLRAKAESSKPLILDPSNVPRKLQHSGTNVTLVSHRGQVASKAAEREPSVIYEKLKKRNFDWLNSFSSEAVILQPSRGEFSIKKLISKTACQERLWGLPPRQSFSRTLGPRMNDNLIQYTALKHKKETDLKKNNLYGDGMGTNQTVKQLIKSAQEKNWQIELKKKKDLSTKSMAKNILKTFKDAMELKPIEILKTIEKKARNNEAQQFQKAHKKKSILNFRIPNLRVKDKQENLVQNNKPSIAKDKPSKTEYQSSASYQQVFRELFNNANKTKSTPKQSLALAFFNRQEDRMNLSRPGIKLPLGNSVRKKILKQPEQSVTVVERNSTVNLKNQARSPFQKPSNTQLTSKSKASFSTVSKIPKGTGSHTVSRPKLLKTTRNKICSQNAKTSKRSITTERKRNEGKQPVIKKTLYSTLGYFPAMPKRLDMTPKKKIQNNKNIHTKKNENKKENKNLQKSANSNRGYFDQRRSLSSFGLHIGSITEMDKPIKTLIEPLNEEVFKEVMSLCKGQPTKVKKRQGSEKDKFFKRYNRCSVQIKKKPEKRRRGFVCRIASMLNIGCATRRRKPNQGCPECGKK